MYDSGRGFSKARSSAVGYRQWVWMGSYGRVPRWCRNSSFCWNAIVQIFRRRRGRHLKCWMFRQSSMAKNELRRTSLALERGNLSNKRNKSLTTCHFRAIYYIGTGVSMDIVGKKVRHIANSNLGTGVVESCDGGICLVRWRHGLKQFAGLSRHPRRHLSLLPNSAEATPLANDPLTW